jgi:hypothetical protein
MVLGDERDPTLVGEHDHRSTPSDVPSGVIGLVLHDLLG